MLDEERKIIPAYACSTTRTFPWRERRPPSVGVTQHADGMPYKTRQCYSTYESLSNCSRINFPSVIPVHYLRPTAPSVSHVSSLPCSLHRGFESENQKDPVIICRASSNLWIEKMGERFHLCLWNHQHCLSMNHCTKVKFLKPQSELPNSASWREFPYSAATTEKPLHDVLFPIFHVLSGDDLLATCLYQPRPRIQLPLQLRSNSHQHYRSGHGEWMRRQQGDYIIQLLLYRKLQLL